MLPRKIFDAIYERDQHFCLLALPGCLGEGGVADHRANRGMGGSQLLSHGAALVLACAICNGRKADAHALTLFDLEERGLWVRPAATHAKTLQRVLSTPVTDLEGRRWLLIDEHTRQEVD